MPISFSLLSLSLSLSVCLLSLNTSLCHPFPLSFLLTAPSLASQRPSSAPFTAHSRSQFMSGV